MASSTLPRFADVPGNRRTVCAGVPTWTWKVDHCPSTPSLSSSRQHQEVRRGGEDRTYQYRLGGIDKTPFDALTEEKKQQQSRTSTLPNHILGRQKKNAEDTG